MKTPAKRKSVLLVGDSYFISNQIADYFQKHGYDVISIGSQASEILAGIRMQPDIIIVNYEMQYNDPYLAIALLHETLPSGFIALMNGYLNHCNSSEARSAGAKKILDPSCEIKDIEEILHAVGEVAYA
ncbi:MAG: response regulator [Bacteroidota bacterium]|nr:response regulator [Bacteroidota bacterium]MDP4229659.1 response regulator [Bacteroidota bacterium]MDP4235270.1 response regulator [Bacteroidota bacterium]